MKQFRQSLKKSKKTGLINEQRCNITKDIIVKKIIQTSQTFFIMRKLKKKKSFFNSLNFSKKS